MAKKKSSLDLNEPVVVQGENVEETAAVTAVETEAEKPAEKKKAEAQKDKVEKKRGVLICVM